MYTGHIAQCKLHCKNCTSTVAHICSINKMGRLHRMLILKACPYQQILSSKGTETTNGTTSQHHPYQQICWSTRWVNRPDCSFWPPFDISCHPETTKWVAHPIWMMLIHHKLYDSYKLYYCQFGQTRNLGEHKIRDRCEVHYILTSLRSWLQSRWTYWGFLPPSSSSPDAFSENIKVCWVINWNVNRKLQLARLSRCETQCYESYSMVTKRAQRLGISCCGPTCVM